MQLQVNEYDYILKYNKDGNIIDIILNINFKINNGFFTSVCHSGSYKKIIGSVIPDSKLAYYKFYSKYGELGTYVIDDYIIFKKPNNIKYKEKNSVKACKYIQRKINNILEVDSKLIIYNTDNIGSYEYIPNKPIEYIQRNTL